MKPTSIASALAAALLALAAQNSSALDLRQSLDAAVRQDPQLASARSQVDTIRERVPQAMAGLMPTVSASAALNRQRTAFTSRDTRIEVTPKQIAISLTQPLLRMDRVETLQQSKLSATQAEAAYEAAKQDLIVRVAAAYFDVVAAQDSLDAVRAQKRAIAEQLASAKRNFQVGTATITDQQEAQARADLTEAQEIAAENDLGNKRNALALLTGKPVTEVSTLDRLRPGIQLLPPEPATDQAWTERARAENLLVRQSELTAEIARRETIKAKYGHWPTLDLVGSGSRSESSVSGLSANNINSMTLGVQLAVPIYAGGAVVAREREVVAARERALSDLENTRRSADQTARQLFRKVTSGLAQVRALEAAERSSQLALDSNVLGYQVGVRINIDVLNAQQQVFSTRRDLALARYTVLVDGLRLRQAVGSLNEDDLGAVNTLLGPPVQPSPPAPATDGGPGAAKNPMAGAAPAGPLGATGTSNPGAPPAEPTRSGKAAGAETAPVKPAPRSKRKPAQP